MISDNPYSMRLTKIDELTLGDHSRLEATDECYYLWEYTPGKGYQHSEINQLILNIKKSPEKRGLPEWSYKESAIIKAANAFCQSLHSTFLDQATLVPIPPSKARSDPLYDDRIARLARAIRESPPVDVRELIVQRESREASHRTSGRRDPEELRKLYEIDRRLLRPEPRCLALVDDVLTSGCHFKAAKALLAEHFPGVRILGLFIARSVAERG